jgi:glycosyltransferase involved in cell wall biosynthesis
VVGYLGTHGMAHALHRVLEAAEILRRRDDIVFLFAGGGAHRTAVEETARRKRLANVRMLPPQPKEIMPRLWSLCDLSLIHLKDDPVFATVIPSKLFESMGMGLPVAMVLPEGEATAIVRETGCGIVVPPEQPRALVDAIAQLCDRPERMEAFRKASRAAAPRFTRARQAERMLSILRTVAEGRGDTVGNEFGSTESFPVH